MLIILNWLIHKCTKEIKLYYDNNLFSNSEKEVIKICGCSSQNKIKLSKFKSIEKSSFGFAS